MLTQRKGPCRVEDHNTQIPGFFQAPAVTHPQSSLSPEGGRDGNHQWHSKTQGVGTGDYKHRYGSNDGEVDWGTKKLPYDECQDSRSKCDGSEKLGCPVRQMRSEERRVGNGGRASV